MVGRVLRDRPSQALGTVVVPASACRGGNAARFAKRLHKRTQPEHPARIAKRARRERLRLSGTFLRADKGTRTLDLLHGKRVVGSACLRRQDASLSQMQRASGL